MRTLVPFFPPLILALPLLAASLPARAAGFGFDSDAQGWSSSSDALLAYQATGGHPGGFLQLTDNSDADFALSAPAAALGDWSLYLGGALSFDAKNLNGDAPDWGTFGTLTLSGSGKTLQQDLVAVGEPPADGQWHRYTIVLTSAVWGPDLAGVLANLQGLTLTGEFHAGVTEVLGLDNIAVSAVPEPAVWPLLALGLTALGLRTQARRRSSP